MQVSTTTNPRVNPAELRYLRQAVDATTTDCRRTAIQAIVVYAQLHDGMDLTGEAAYLLAEMEQGSSKPRLCAVADCLETAAN
ncbi:hypothetical protein HER32_11825 [Hymenobacter sp. BT18]|uniref:hypothetical protein n=1 Tax=Hymenobacter sp. BT18 TaxID=2835648 RepID=UPI00143E282F|nr:hypothetical protein [Hymenobacter sp. BT18]QIX61830.1 hypothetical protein HER32_11825 [Hymenobacter sp. BT18]